jgi:hypothetical protein
MLHQNGSSNGLFALTVNDATEVSGNTLILELGSVPIAISGIADNAGLPLLEFDANAAFTLSYAASWPYLNTNVTNSVNVPAYDSSQYAIGEQSHINLNQRGLTGTWANPTTDGQGIVMEVEPDFYGAGTGILFGGWYTYDATANGQQWYTLQGQVSSTSTTATIPIYLTQGGHFDAAGATTTSQVGQATLSFADCNHGSMAYAFSDGSGRSGTIPLTRLLPNATCQP